MARLKRKKRKKQNRKLAVIEKSILKIVAFILIIGLNWTGLLAVGRTFSYFNDRENSLGNNYSAGTLDFYLQAPGDFSLNLTANSVAVRNVHVLNRGSLPFQYIIEGKDFSGPLCEKLNLEAKLNGTEKYNGSLTSFSLSSPVLFSHPDNWQFKFTFEGNVETYKNTPCQFNFLFRGWQDNITDYNFFGFKDEEEVLTHLMLRAEKTVVLNEFLPNPFGDDCELQGLAGEWVELYNNSDAEMDLAGWYIKDAQDHAIVIDNSNTHTDSTIIGPKGSGSEWLVVFLNGCILNNNGGDTVKLYHSAGSLADYYSYIDSTPEGKSYARYPDGSGPWYDPVPTPGGPNKLELLETLESSIVSDLFVVAGSSGQEEVPGGGSGVSEVSETPEIPIIETATPALEEMLPILGPEPEPELESILETATPSSDKPTVEFEPEPEPVELPQSSDTNQSDQTESNDPVTAPSDDEPEPEPEPESEPEPETETGETEEEIIQEEPILEEELPIEEEPVVGEESVVEEGELIVGGSKPEPEPKLGAEEQPVVEEKPVIEDSRLEPLKEPEPVGLSKPTGLSDDGGEPKPEPQAGEDLVSENNNEDDNDNNE